MAPIRFRVHHGTPRLLLAALSLALLALAACSPAAPAASPGSSSGSGQGQLVARSAVVDLGRVPFDRVVEATYELENVGGRPVRLTAMPTVRTLEGC